MDFPSNFLWIKNFVLYPSRDDLRVGFHEANALWFLLRACTSVNTERHPREEEVSWHFRSCLRKLLSQQEQQRAKSSQSSGFWSHRTSHLQTGKRINPQGRITDHNKNSDYQMQPPCNTAHTNWKLSSLDTAAPPDSSRLQNLPKIQVLNTNRRMQGQLTQGCCYFRLLAEDRSIKSWLYPNLFWKKSTSWMYCLEQRGISFSRLLRYYFAAPHF